MRFLTVFTQTNKYFDCYQTESIIFFLFALFYLKVSSFPIFPFFDTNTKGGILSFFKDQEDVYLDLILWLLDIWIKLNIYLNTFLCFTIFKTQRWLFVGRLEKSLWCFHDSVLMDYCNFQVGSITSLTYCFCMLWLHFKIYIISNEYH